MEGPIGTTSISRADLRCPGCLTTGLAATSRADAYEGETALVHGSQCPNTDCNVERVDPETIAKQLETTTSTTIGPRGYVQSLLSVKHLALVGAALLLASAAAIAVGPAAIAPGGGLASFGGDTGSPGPASDTGTGPLNETPTNVTSYPAPGDWTVVGAGDQYVVSGQVNGTVVFLGPDGDPTETPQYFSTIEAARQAVLAWQARHKQAPSQYPGPGPSSIDPSTTNWSIYTHGDAHIVAGSHNGRVVFLASNGIIASQPRPYATTKQARQALLAWVTRNDSQRPVVTAVDERTVMTALEQTDEEWDTTMSGDSLAVRNTSEQIASRSVSGVVTNSNGTPISGATVVLHSDPRSTTTGPNGTFAFENVTNGSHRLYVDPQQRGLAATPATRFQMAINGTMTMRSVPSNVRYFGGKHGVANNRVQILAPAAQSITYTGQGANLSAPITFAQPANAETISVELSGVYAPEQRTTTVTNGTVSVEGNVPPQNSSLRVDPQVTRVNRTASGRYQSNGENPVVDIAGNRPPANATLRLERAVKTERTSSQGRVTNAEGSISLATAGNLPATDGTLTLRAASTVETHRIGDIHIGASVGWDHQESISGTRTLFTAPRDGTYRLKVPWTIETGSVLKGWYQGDVEMRLVAGGETVVSRSQFGDKHTEETITSTVQLERGETLALEYDMTGPAFVEFEPTSDAVTLQGEAPGNVTISTPSKSVTTSSLAVGEQTTVALGKLPVGATIDVETATVGASALDYTLTRTVRTATESPTVRVNGQSVCTAQGVLQANQSCSIPSLDSGETTLNVSTAAGPVDYTLAYVGRAAPTTATVTLDGEAVSSSTMSLANGSISSTVDLQLGENRLAVSTPSVEGISTNATLHVTYTGDATRTARPVVTVTAPNGTTHRRPVPAAALRNGLLYGNATMELPAAWFGSGRNVVGIQTAADSQVRVRLVAQGTEFQRGSFTAT